MCIMNFLVLSSGTYVIRNETIKKMNKRQLLGHGVTGRLLVVVVVLAEEENVGLIFWEVFTSHFVKKFTTGLQGGGGVKGGCWSLHSDPLASLDIRLET